MGVRVSGMWPQSLAAVVIHSAVLLGTLWLAEQAIGRSLILFALMLMLVLGALGFLMKWMQVFVGDVKAALHWRKVKKWRDPSCDEP